MPRPLAAWAIIVVLVSACGAGTAEPPSGPTSSGDTATTRRSGADPPHGETAMSVRVLDGDSIEVELSGGTAEVRLAGINAPERDECYGDAAREALSGYLAVPPITLVSAGDENADRHGRLLRYVYAGGVAVAEEMLGSGYANVLQGDHPRDATFVELADEAASSHLGMWQQDACGPATNAAAEISAVEYNPPGSDGERAAQEYVVIVNGGATSLDLTDWIVRDESTQHRYRFPPTTLASGEALRLRTGCGEDGPTDLYWCAGDAVWSNRGDTALLQDPNGNVVDRVRYRGDY